MDDRQQQQASRSRWDHFIAGDGTATDRANNRRFNRLSLLWAASLIACSALVGGVEMPTALKWVVALTPNLFAIMTLRGYLKVLRMTDEMMRRIHLEGLAVGFGTGYIFVIGYLLAEHAGAPPLNLAVLTLVMTAGWVWGNLRAMRSYQ